MPGKKSRSAGAKPRKTRVVGLTGGIAGGKTTVARMFGSLGAAVVSADRIAREVVRRPSVLRRVARRWGAQMVRNGRLDRRRLASVVFENPQELRALEAMTHPLILRDIRDRIRRHKRQQAPLIILDAPLLNEAGLDSVCDCQIFVEAGKALRCLRAARDRDWSPAELVRRERQQLSLGEKKRRAALVIDNSGTRAAALARVRRAWKALVPM